MHRLQSGGPPSNNANGTRRRQGRLVTCEHGYNRRVTRTEPMKHSVSVLAERFWRRTPQQSERRGRQVP